MADIKAQEPVSDRKSIWYEILRFLSIIVFHTVMPVKCHNSERLNGDTPYILVSNHRHALDPLAIAIFIPGKQICFLGKKELGRNRLSRRIMTSAYVILVSRGDTDMAAMRNCVKAIRMKKILLIFPEGTRHHKGQMEEIQSGTSLIAMRSGAPIVPVYIDRELGFFRRTNLYCGEPIPYSDLAEKGINAETCEELNERFRETFRKMIAETESASKKN